MAASTTLNDPRAPAIASMCALTSEAGVEVELTRRGQPVAVVVSHREFARLRGKQLHFSDAYRRFLESHSLQESGIERNFVTTLRNRTTGRKVSL